MEEATRIFLESGLLGAVAIVLAGVIVYQQKKIDLLHKELVSVQEKWRLSETERTERLTEIANTSSAIQAALVDKIEIGKGRR